MSKKISKKNPAIKFPKEIRELAQEFCRQRIEEGLVEKRRERDIAGEKNVFAPPD